jgi:hypothetical protein
MCSRLYYLGVCKYTFAQQRNRLTTHFSELIPVVKRRISVAPRSHKTRSLWNSTVHYRVHNSPALFAIPSPFALFPSHFLRAVLLRTALYWVVTQRVVVILYVRFETTCGSHSQGSKTSVRNYRYSLRNNPEERSSHLIRGVSLRSRTVLMLSLHHTPRFSK